MHLRRSMPSYPYEGLFLSTCGKYKGKSDDALLTTKLGEVTCGMCLRLKLGSDWRHLHHNMKTVASRARRDDCT